MTLPVLGFPAGLTGALNLKGMGRNPSDLGETYLPTVECIELFLLNNQEFLDSITTFAAVNNAGVVFPNMQVPLNENWYVWKFDVQSAPMGVGVSLTLNPLVYSRPNAAVCIGPARAGVGAASTVQVFAPADGPFWMRPGAQLGFFTESMAGAPAASGHAFITRVRV